MEATPADAVAQERPPEAVDPPDRRPGVPMEAEPAPAEGARPGEPERQAGTEGHFVRVGLDRPTPVVGTAQPPHGLSGAIRRRAYDVPEHEARHWMMLLLADRVDVLEDRLGSSLAGPLERAGLDAGARVVRENPLAVVAGAAVAFWVTRRALS